MSQLWSAALRKAYPAQEAHYRPSSIGSCALKQAANVNGVGRTDGDDLYIWNMEIGRIGQEVAVKALPHLGFEFEESIKVEGPMPGEGDARINILPTNVFGLEPGLALWECKLRTTYFYNHILKGEDLLVEEASTAMQATMYMGQLGLKRTIITYFPFDVSAARSDQNFGKNRPDVWKGSVNLRIMLAEFNPELYMIGLERQASLIEHGVNVAREFNPADAKYPCAQGSYICDVYSWCVQHGGGGIEIAKVPSSGMPLTELVLA